MYIVTKLSLYDITYAEPNGRLMHFALIIDQVLDAEPEMIFLTGNNFPADDKTVNISH